MRVDDAVLAEEIVASLSLDDPTRGQRSSAKLLAGSLFGLASAVRRSPRRTVNAESPVTVVIHNPVQHGARLAAALIVAGSFAPVAVLADARHAESVLGDDIRDLPGVGPRAIHGFGCISRLRVSARIRRSTPGRGFLSAAPSRIRAEVALLAQTLRYLAALETDFTGTRLVVTDFDRGTTARPWIWVARKAGVRVVTAVHGSLAAATYLPMLASDALVWGQVQAEWLIAQGAEVTAHVTGRADIDGRLPLGREVDRVVICHSREELDADEQASLLALVASARAAGLAVVIRRHPSEHGMLGATWCDLEQQCDVVASVGSPLSGFLTPRDLVVGVASTALVDALVSGHPSAVVASPLRALPADLEAMARVTATVDPGLNGAGLNSAGLNREYVDAMAALSERIVNAVGPEAAQRLSETLRQIFAETRAAAG